MTAQLDLVEWQTLSPGDSPELAGRYLDASPATLRLIDELETSNSIGIDELRSGLRLRTFSHVGRFQLSDLQITIRPKIEQPSLLNLLRYAYGFRKLRILAEADQSVENYGFEDLLISQLNAESHEILTRGVHRTYIGRRELLSAPRGRLDMQEIARTGDSLGAALPCRHHPRMTDTPLNRVLLAGMHLAASMASDLGLARESRRLAAQLDEQVGRIRLNTQTLVRIERRINRLTAAYAPAVSIIRLLAESSGVSLEGVPTQTRLPGFLFDMNAFFQALIERFLTDNLDGHEVIGEYKLKRMMRYVPGYNPLRRSSPTPRPDYVIRRKGKVAAILDAKYRDLWDKSLPSRMLYQLVVYAISHRDNPHSAIIYPTTDTAAREQRIEVSDPIYGKRIGRVSLRPVNLSQLESAIADPTATGRERRREIASRLALS